MSDSEPYDFKYNGIPIFKVGLLDFSYIVNCFESKNRLFSKNIQNEQLKNFYIKSRTNSFGIFYEGVIIDFRDLKNLF